MHSFSRMPLLKTYLFYCVNCFLNCSICIFANSCNSCRHCILRCHIKYNGCWNWYVLFFTFLEFFVFIYPVTNTYACQFILYFLKTNKANRRLSVCLICCNHFYWENLSFFKTQVYIKPKPYIPNLCRCRLLFRVLFRHKQY